MSDLEILDNIIPLKFQNEIKETINSNNFQWYFYNSVFGENEIMNPKNKKITEGSIWSEYGLIKPATTWNISKEG